MAPRYAFDRVDSTQELALAHARRHGPEPATFVARTQARGVGRLDHAWASPSGGLYLSRVSPLPRHRPELVPLGVAAALGQALAGRYGVPVALRWPNDLLALAGGRPRKIAGVLADLVEGTRGSALIVGIGVNLGPLPADWPVSLRASAATMAEFASPPPTPEEVEPLAVAAVDTTVARLADEAGGHAVVDECRSMLYGLGRHVLVDDEPAGIARRLDDDGTLWVESGDALQPVRAGTLTVEEGP